MARRRPQGPRLTIGAAEHKQVGGRLFLDAACPAACAARVPVHVRRVDVIGQLRERTRLIVQQVPAQDLVVVAARVDLVRMCPADAAHQLAVCSVVKVRNNYNLLGNSRRLGSRLAVTNKN